MIYLYHEPIESLADLALRDGDEVHFDDGYATALTGARMLEDRDQRATVFVVTRWLGLPGFLTRKDVRALAASGHRIGNHTASHAWLGKLPAPARFLEVAEAQDTLAQLTGTLPTAFAYPFGRMEPPARSTVRAFGFALARGIDEVAART